MIIVYGIAFSAYTIYHLIRYVVESGKYKKHLRDYETIVAERYNGNALSEDEKNRLIVSLITSNYGPGEEMLSKIWPEIKVYRSDRSDSGCVLAYIGDNIVDSDDLVDKDIKVISDDSHDDIVIGKMSHKDKMTVLNRIDTLKSSLPVEIAKLFSEPSYHILS